MSDTGNRNRRWPGTYAEAHWTERLTGFWRAPTASRCRLRALVATLGKKVILDIVKAVLEAARRRFLSYFRLTVCCSWPAAIHPTNLEANQGAKLRHRPSMLWRLRVFSSPPSVSSLLG